METGGVRPCRPGIEALLEQFAGDVEGLEAGTYPFNWKP